MFITPNFLLIAFALFLAVIFIPSLLATSKFQKALKKYLSDENLVRTLGLILIIISFLFLSVHWKLSGGWYIIIPILGWLTLFKGITFLYMPGTVYKMSKKFLLSSGNLTSFMGFICLLISIGLLYVGIYVY